MEIRDEIKAIEARNKYADIFYEYEDWYINDSIKEVGEYDNSAIEEIKGKLPEILKYCALREWHYYGMTALSDSYYEKIADTCKNFSTNKKLYELYEELEIEDPYKEKEPEDDYDRYEHEWEREIKSTCDIR